MRFFMQSQIAAQPGCTDVYVALRGALANRKQEPQ